MKQRNVPGLGKLYLQFAGASLYFTAGNLAVSTIVLWQVSGSSWAVRHAPWLSLPVFLALAACGMYALMQAHWHLVERSKNDAASKQSYIEENPAVQDLNQIKADVAKIKKKLGIDVE